MNYRENRVHSSKVKPFSYYQCLIPDEFAYAPMHWHSEFEINFVREGLPNSTAETKSLSLRQGISLSYSQM